MSSPPIVIAGAGLGGLAAALCLAKSGRRTLVIERAQTIEEVGAGLQISPNAGRILQNLGLGQALQAIGLEPKAFRIRRAQDGQTLARLPLDEAPARWGASFRVFHRADLQNALLDQARRIGDISIRTGVKCVDFTQTADALDIRVRTEQGPETLTAAALVGADGLRSSVRAHMRFGEGDDPVYSGHTAWRALIPADAAPACLRERETQLWMGPGAHVVHYPLRDASIISAVAIVEDGLAEESGRSILSLTGEALTHTIGFERWHADLRALIEAGASWRRWPLFGRPELPRWSKGRVTLLGDAAHPMLPFLAQGAAQAIEDAAALGRALEAEGRSVETALEAYQAARMQRAAQVLRRSRAQGYYFHLRGAAAQARDFAIRALGGRGMLARNAWLYR
ncbi:MAG: FAD-dependent monooxygenase [Methylocystis sp.]|nr:FAD-dependent monooxygenase [Methylocystis sp.]MBI3275206.1 FAD-dependent monooxygenase [Methylocystis sp.]